MNWMPRTYGVCEAEGCQRTRRTTRTPFCPACNKRIRDRAAKSASRARMQARQSLSADAKRARAYRARVKRHRADERGLDEMMAKPLRRVRRHALDDVTSTPETREPIGWSNGTSYFWKRWIENPDNLCDEAALDRAGW